MFSSMNTSASAPFHNTSATVPASADTTTTIDSIKSQIDDIIGNKHPLVFCGFSGLEYKNNEEKVQWICNVLDKAINDYGGVHNIIVVAGATEQGIGGVYDVIAKNYLGLETMGIVSDKAQGTPGISAACIKENIVYVSAPVDNPGTWEVKNAAGKSYMVYAATLNNGDLYFYGGGKVALNEFLEAEKHELTIFWSPRVEPNPDKLEEAQKKRPGEDLTALRTYYEKHRNEGFGDNVHFID